MYVGSGQVVTVSFGCPGALMAAKDNGPEFLRIGVVHMEYTCKCGMYRKKRHLES